MTKDRNAFEPRVGFAFQENSKMVLRGGYGIYASLPNAAQIFDTGNTEPWSATTILGGPANAAQSLANPTRSGGPFRLCLSGFPIQPQHSLALRR